MGGDLAAQYRGLFVHQNLKFVAVAPQLLLIPFPCGFQLAVLDRLLAKDLRGTLHACDLIVTLRHHGAVQLAVGKVRHVERQPVETPGDVSPDVEPQDREGHQERGQAGPDVALLRRAHRGHDFGHRGNRALFGLSRAPLGRAAQRSGRYAKRRLFADDPGVEVENGGRQGDHVSLRKSGDSEVLDRRQQLLRLLGPARVADGRYAPLHDVGARADVVAERGKFRDFGKRRNLVQAQTHFGRHGAQFEHQAKLKQVDLDQLVQRIQALAP